ncbi:MAG: helix-turn-helix domain-containing protein [Alphaproteobacteria bacterium]|nr:helix-turn-helix domain-containing protein [Alphaproteobacteria bacterium]
MHLGERIKATRKALGETQGAFGARFGVGASAISMWENAHERPDGDKLPQLAEILGEPLDGLVREVSGVSADGESKAPLRLVKPRTDRGFSHLVSQADHATGPNIPRVANTPQISALPFDVPMRGTARGDNDGKGDFTFNGETAGYVRRLPGLAGVKDAFALYVQGTSMAPWRDEGGLVYVNPHRPPRPGDHVVVEMRPTVEGEPGLVWIKRLVARGADGSLTLAQYNPPNDRIKLSGTKILRLFRVAEWEELIA